MDQSPSFESTEIDAILTFFKQWGYVVIRDALTLTEVNETVDEIWHHPTLLGGNPAIERSNPETWSSDNWPTTDGGPGFLDSNDDFQNVKVWRNRQNPKIVGLFEAILNELLTPEQRENKGMRVVQDRLGIMRPTKNIVLNDGTKVNHPEWKTQTSWLHWDQNPWSEPGFQRLQGIIALSDHTNTSGGFDCVPSFFRQFEQWAKEHPIEETGHTLQHGFIKVPKQDPMWDHVQHITMSAGSLLIWDSRLPHQNYPNDDHTWRIVQYITFHYVDHEESERKYHYYIQAIQNGLIPKSFIDNATPLGRKVFGLCHPEKSEEETPEFPPLTESQLSALEFLKQAKKTEAEGFPREAAQLFRRAFKLNPELEEIFNFQER